MGWWIVEHWPEILQNAGIIGGFVFTAVNLRLDIKARRVSNLLKITEGHRDLWSNLYEQPGLARVLDPAVNLEENPISDQEELFVVLLVLRSSAQEAMKQGMFTAPEGLSIDIRSIFSKPIPRSVWERNKVFHDSDFVEFVEQHLLRFK